MGAEKKLLPGKDRRVRPCSHGIFFIMKDIRPKSLIFFLSLGVMLAFLSAGGDASLNAYWVDEPVWGAWVSPDWFFPGTRRYSEFDIRQTARKTLQAMAEQGINNIFLETYLRGYSIAAVPDKLQGTFQASSEGPLPAGRAVSARSCAVGLMLTTGSRLRKRPRWG